MPKFAAVVNTAPNPATFKDEGAFKVLVVVIWPVVPVTVFPGVSDKKPVEVNVIIFPFRFRKPSTTDKVSGIVIAAGKVVPPGLFIIRRL